MTTYSLFELEPIFIDLKNTSYGLGLDIQANQNDTLTLNFICRNNGEVVDMSKYKVELRVHNNNSNTDYIQTQNENVTLETDGSVKIVCQSLKGNKLTAYSGQCNGILRIFNTENKQKATRIITMRIVADPFEEDKANICESTITKLEELDWVLNEAYNIEDEFRKAIEEAIKTKDELVKTTNEAKVINSTLAGNITTGTELNNNLVNSNKLAETNQKELDTRNTAANKNIETLTKENTTANETIINISNKIEKGTKLDNDLEEKTIIGTTLKSDLDTNIKTGTQLKTDLIELIPQVNKSKSDLDTSKRNADLSNTTLTETTNNAETKKQEIVAECKVADEKIKQMNEFGDVTEVVKDVTSLKIEVTTARDNEIDLNTRLERDKTNILNIIGNVNVETDGNVASQLKDIAKPNLLINGDFQVWQRGTNFNVANNRFIYTSDRWCGISNFQNSTIKKDGEYIKFEINEVGNGDDFNILQGLESMNVIPLRNRKVTLSLDIKKYSNMLSGDIAINIYCGTGTDELLANTNRVAFDKVISYSELSETPKRFNLSTELPNNVSSLCVVIRCGSRYGNKPNNGASFGVKNVKLELGSVATPFIPRSYGEELVLCQRYYQRYTTKGAVYDTNNLIINEMFTVSMRTRPTVKITNDILFDINQFKEIQFTISSLNVYSTYIGNILSNENNLVKGNLYVVSIILDAEIY
ncbi:hypothetical protein [Clostridium sp. ZS2]|uniref:hypothetical protein n=1 Tax=Clostridium sp. ZS2 TaxID=2949988 RepID=UPI00207A0463|nr:hypothetical protein [Clostridium sp. ZS2]